MKPSKLPEHNNFESSDIDRAVMAYVCLIKF